MRSEEGLLRDLSLLLELALVPAEQQGVDGFVDEFVDRLLSRTFASNALIFVRSDLHVRSTSLDDVHEPMILNLADPQSSPESQESFVALPQRRAQYLVRTTRLDPRRSGIEDAMAHGSARLVRGADSCLAQVSFGGIDLPDEALQLPVGDVGLLEMYAGMDGLLDEHLGRVLTSLAAWLAGQVHSFAARAALEARLGSTQMQGQWLRSLIDDLPGVVWQSDLHGRVNYVSRQAGPILGLSQVQSWRQLRQGVHPADAARIDHEIAEAIADHRPLVHLEYRYRRGSEEPFVVRERIALGFQEDGGLVVKIGFVYPVQVDGLEQIGSVPPPSFESGRSPLSDLEFMDKLSHELRSPLFPVIALSDLLLQLEPSSVSTEDWKRHLQMINASGKELLELVSDLLELSRMDVGRTRLEPAPVVAEHFMRDLQRKLGAQSGEDSPRIETVIDLPNPQVSVYAERLSLERAASSLVQLAVQASSDRRVVAELSATDSRLRLAVRTKVDSAMLQISEKIFEPFSTFDRTGKARMLGSGLTASVVKQISELLGGGTSVEAVGGDEIELAVELPCALGRLGHQPAAGRSVMCVGTDLAELVTISTRLLAVGASVQIARSSEELARILPGRPADVLIVSSAMFGRRRIQELLDERVGPDAKRPRVLALGREPEEPTAREALFDAWISPTLEGDALAGMLSPPHAATAREIV